jgi:hypothetical protein
MATAKKAVKTTAVAVVKKNEVGAAGDWRAELSKYAAKTVKMEESMQSGNKISTRGGRLSYHDTPLKNNEMTVLVLSALIENVYYEGAFDADNPSSPICFAFSDDGENMEPHEKAHEKQHEQCQGCPHDEWGTSNTGKGKACKNVRRLAVMSMDDVTENNILSGEIATLNVPVMSVKGYSAYVKELALTAGLPPFAWQTRVWLEPDAKSQFRVCFQAIDKKPLPEKFYPAILKRVKEAEKLLDVPYTYVEPPEPKAKGKAAAKKKF